MDIFDEFFNKNTLYFDAFDKMVEAVYICDVNKNLVYFNKVAEDVYKRQRLYRRSCA